MSDHYNSDDYQVYKNLAQTVRGEYLESFVGLEKMIDFFIALHFCPHPADRERAHELLDLIVCTDRITFEGKRQVFKFLVEKYNSVFCTNHKSVFKDLVDFMETRNILAHYVLYAGKDAIERFMENGAIQFVKFKNDRTFIQFTEQRISEKISLIVEYTTTIKDELLGDRLPI